MSRTVLVPKDSLVLRHASTRPLNLYPNGSALVETDAPIQETGESGEVNVSSGLHLDGVEEAQLDAACKRFEPAEAASPEGQPAAEEEELISAYVEFIGPLDPRWLAQLRELGINVLSYHPENSYLCFGPVSAFREALKRVKTTAGELAIPRVIELTVDFKPQATRIGDVAEIVVITLVAAAEERQDVLSRLKSVPGLELLGGAGNDPLDANRFRVRARIERETQSDLLELPRVLSIERYRSPIPEDEVAGLVLAGLYDASYRPSGSYAKWLQDHAVDGKGVTIGIVDGGVDISHPAFTGRAQDLAGGQKDWHATMVAGHAAGNYLTEKDTNGLAYGLGTAPAATILSQDKMGSATDLCQQTVNASGSPSAIQNNSWGKDTHDPMDYRSDEALYDALVRNAVPGGPAPLPLTICFSSGNSGTLGLTRPKAAKNLIVTGNSENYRPDVSPSGSDNIREVYSGPHGSSYGNCGDGRIRPHVVAPGEWTASANYDCHPGEDEYISPRLTWGGGSSGASPKTAGACALLTQWWRTNHNKESPSPAMLRALIVNGAEPILTGGPIPNNRQGWGRLNVQNILDSSVACIMEDQRSFLTQPTESREWRVRAANPTKPVKITLAWTDPPGAVGTGGSSATSPIVNKLALRAECGKAVFRGTHDRFRNGLSASDDAIAQEGIAAPLREGTDNLQNIFLLSSYATGSIRVTVTALNITTNCLTGGFDTPQQDFALVITNAQLDAGSSSPAVAVAVEDNASAAPPLEDSNDYWSGADGNDDQHLLGEPAASGTTSNPPAGPMPTQPGGGASSPPSPTEDDSAWWTGCDGGTSSPGESEPWWDAAGSASHSETERHGEVSKLIEDAAFAGRLAAGFKLLSMGNSQAGGGDLSRALAGLLERYKRESAPSGAPPLAAVLVVGAGTRVTVADIGMLRVLAATGKVYLVSGDAGIIAFLAQRIGRLPGIRYRLAREPGELADLVLEVMAEAGGFQPIVVAGPVTAMTESGAVWTYHFDVVANDRAIVIHSRAETGSVPKRARLVRAECPEVVWNPTDGASSTDISFDYQNGLLEIRVAGAGLATGPWTVEVTGDPAEQPAVVKAWAMGGPWISVTETPIAAAEESGRTDESRLVRIAGEPGISLVRATTPPPRAATPLGQRVGEVPRSIVAQVRRSRLDNAGQSVSEVDQRPIPVPALGQVLKLPAPTIVASVLDVPIEILGVTGAGQYFARVVRTNLVRLQSVAQWQADLAAAAPKVLFVHGYITEAQLRGGLVVALRLCQGPYTRVVRIKSPALGRDLAAFDFSEVRTQEFIFGVRDGELLSLFRQILDGSPTKMGALPEIRSR